MFEQSSFLCWWMFHDWFVYYVSCFLEFYCLISLILLVDIDSAVSQYWHQRSPPKKSFDLAWSTKASIIWFWYEMQFPYHAITPFCCACSCYWIQQWFTCFKVKWSEVENITTVLCIEFSSSSFGWKASILTDWKSHRQMSQLVKNWSTQNFLKNILDWQLENHRNITTNHHKMD